MIGALFILLFKLYILINIIIDCIDRARCDVNFPFSLNLFSAFICIWPNTCSSSYSPSLTITSLKLYSNSGLELKISFLPVEHKIACQNCMQGFSTLNTRQTCFLENMDGFRYQINPQLWLEIQIAIYNLETYFSESGDWEYCFFFNFFLLVI